VVVIAVEKDNLHRRFGKQSRKLNPTKAATDNDDAGFVCFGDVHGTTNAKRYNRDFDDKTGKQSNL
jgi:hypothetical protein